MHACVYIFVYLDFSNDIFKAKTVVGCDQIYMLHPHSYSCINISFSTLRVFKEQQQEQYYCHHHTSGSEQLYYLFLLLHLSCCHVQMRWREPSVYVRVFDDRISEAERERISTLIFSSDTCQRWWNHCYHGYRWCFTGQSSLALFQSLCLCPTSICFPSLCAPPLS